MLSCKAIEARSRRDYQALHKAWQAFDAAKARMARLAKAGASLKTHQITAPKRRAYERARAAVDQADREVRSASAQVQRSLSAMNKCMRKSSPRQGTPPGVPSLSGARRRRRRR